MIKTTLITAALALTICTAVFAETYVIDSDKSHASINFETSHLGFSILTGRFDTFSGSIDYNSADLAASGVSVDIDMASVNTNHGPRDNHLRSGDFFDVDNYPKGGFTSTSTSINVTGDKTAVITGDLTMRGITKSVNLDAVFIGGGADPWGGYRLGFSGTTTIQLKDFGMEGVIGDAAVKITVHAETIQQ